MKTPSQSPLPAQILLSIGLVSIGLASQRWVAVGIGLGAVALLPRLANRHGTKLPWLTYALLAVPFAALSVQVPIGIVTRGLNLGCYIGFYAITTGLLEQSFGRVRSRWFHAVLASGVGLAGSGLKGI